MRRPRLGYDARMRRPAVSIALAAAVVLLSALNLWQWTARADASRDLVDRFTIFWTRSGKTWRANHWLGIKTLQNPFDVWVTQEILWEVKPDVVLETGTYEGGSAALWATLLEQINPDAGRVLTIDIEDKSAAARRLPIVQRRVDFLVGSSTAPEIVEEVKRRVEGKRVLVVLDSLHTRDHVLAELQAYAPLVPVGSYVIVQDTVVNGHPSFPDWGPGPYEAVEAFLAENDDFVVDRSRERLLMTYNRMGFLRRVR
jgi:cephalosporin hydroxylase